MARRRRVKENPYRDHPNLLTTLNSVAEKYRKLEWNFERYEDAVLRRPCDPDDVMFTALDFCVAATALRDWTKLRFRQEARAGNSFNSELATEDDVLTHIYRTVRWQGAIDSISRAIKHGTYDDTSWREGVAFPATFMPGDRQPEIDSLEDGVAILHYMHANRAVAWWDVNLIKMGDEEGTPGYIAFGDALEDWQKLLERWGFLKS